jgi:hypothetical protein
MSTNFAGFRNVAGIDPGLASGGFVIIDRADQNRVLESISFVEKKGSVSSTKAEAKALATRLDGWGDIDFTAATLRADAWMETFIKAFETSEASHGPIDAIAVESFVDQAQHARKIVQKRWQTPLVIGMLNVELTSRGFTTENGRLIYQDAGRVLKQFSAERGVLAARRTNNRDVIVPGDRRVTNEHKRSALSHALAFSLRLPPYQPTSPKLTTSTD